MANALQNKLPVGSVQPALMPDRRLHKRYPLSLLGRFMRENKDESPCRMVDISVGGVSLLSPVDVEMGERIVVYFDVIGGLDGTVVRKIDGGFALQLTISPHKREKLAAQITFLVNRDELSLDEARRNARSPVNQSSTLKLADNLIITVKLSDVSITGASLVTEARPPLGSEVSLGRMRARVVRHHHEGIAIRFLENQSA
jgi:PilZ domain